MMANRVGGRSELANLQICQFLRIVFGQFDLY